MISKKLPTYIENSEALFALVADQHWAQWLDSGYLKKQDVSLGDADVMVIQPNKTLVTKQGLTEIIDCKTQEKVHLTDDPLNLLAIEIAPYQSRIDIAVQQTKNHIAKLFAPVFGGAFGFFSYEFGRYIEDVPANAQNDIAMPDMALGLYEVVLLSSHKHKESWLIDITGENAELIEKWMEHYQQYLLDDSDRPLKNPWHASGELISNYSHDEYRNKFDQIKAYLKSGDAYQINLTKRFQVNVKGDAFVSYCKMRELSPAPYGAYMNFPFATLLSNSPEQFIECDANNILTSPIKGTMPRDKDVLERDLALANQLEDSEKDQAENLMIVDLMRNDLGRVCEVGSVTVPKLFGIESYANVHHMVSLIRGRLREDCNVIDLLKACFPGGSITGAPKKRAMEIIDQLEPTCRGAYCGAIGWIGFGGNMQTNIAIRTISYIDGVAYFSAGGGIVMDSDVDAEYQELKDKAKIMLKIVDCDAESY